MNPQAPPEDNGQGPQDAALPVRALGREVHLAPVQEATLPGIDHQEEEDEGPSQHYSTFARCYAHKMPSGTESIGYEMNESQQYLEYLKRIGKLKWRCFKGGFRWALLGLIGMTTGLVAISVDCSIEQLAELRVWVNDRVVRNVRMTPGGAPGGVWLQYLAYVGLRLVFASVAGFLVCYVEVLAAGSGIPEIKCYLNGIRLKHVVGFKALVAKAVGIVFSVAADLPVGKEGPMIHSGAIIGALATRINVRQRIRPFSVDSEKRDLVAAGASAGVSAAFGAPMGSVLFAIEEGTSHMNTTIMMRCFVSCAVAALVSRVFAAGPSFSLMGELVPVSFDHFANADYDLRELFFFTLLAMLGGTLGSLFNALNKQLTLWRKRHIPTRGLKRFLEVLVVNVFIVSLLFWIPVGASGGAPITYEELDETLQLFWETGTQSMKKLFHNEGSFHWGYLSIFALLNFELSCLTYGLGVPSGLFVPSLLTGAAYGRLVGQAVHFYFHESTWAHAGIYSLIGAVANLAGTARITISLAMILMEATGNATFSLPIFYTVMVAKWTGDALTCVTGKGIYDMHIIELKHVPLLEQIPEKHLYDVKVREVMAQNPVTFEAIEEVGKLINVLEGCSHNAFPVVYPTTRRLAGMVRRSVLHRILEHCLDQQILQDPRGELHHRLPPVRYEDVAFNPSKLDTFEKLRAALDPDYMQHKLDLRPYINRNGYMMPKHASVASCFMLFRQLGLRHLPIVASDGDVCGVVTRKDLIVCEEDHKHLPAEEAPGHEGGDLQYGRYGLGALDPVPTSTASARGGVEHELASSSEEETTEDSTQKRGLISSWANLGGGGI